MCCCLGCDLRAVILCEANTWVAELENAQGITYPKQHSKSCKTASLKKSSSTKLKPFFS